MAAAILTFGAIETAQVLHPARFGLREATDAAAVRHFAAPPTAIAEPSSLLLLGPALIAMGLLRRHRATARTPE